jgi:hypothetical protein
MSDAYDGDLASVPGLCKVSWALADSERKAAAAIASEPMSRMRFMALLR